LTEERRKEDLLCSFIGADCYAERRGLGKDVYRRKQRKTRTERRRKAGKRDEKEKSLHQVTGGWGSTHPPGKNGKGMSRFRHMPRAEKTNEAKEARQNMRPKEEHTDLTNRRELKKI